MRATHVTASLLTLLLGACFSDQGSDTAVSGSSAAGSTGGGSTGGGSTGATSTDATTTGATSTGATGTATDSTTPPVTTGPATGDTGDMTSGTGTSTTAAATTTTSGPGSSTGPDELLFLCGTCLCDAAVAYCREIGAGLVDGGLPPDTCPIVGPDQLMTGCVLYPESCAGAPSCDCVPLKDNLCMCNESQGAITVSCP